MDKSTNTKTTIGGGVGGALGVLVVFFLPQFTEITFTGETGALVATAFGIVFSAALRYLPQPGG